MKARLLSLLALLPALFAGAVSAAPYAPPSSGRATCDFNPDWQFIKQDVPGAEAADFNDKSWTTVSTPHTWNDVDSYDEHISRAGEKTLYVGPAWYRKHFKLPANIPQGSRVVIEFEGMRQAGKITLTAKRNGLQSATVTLDSKPVGIVDGLIPLKP